MSVYKRIRGVYERAPRLAVDESSRIVLLSDCHRGTGGGGDNFARNQQLFYVALREYYDQGYTYIELGDGDDLWEVRDFQEIAETYGNVFSMLRLFHEKKRFFMLYGNHDRIKSKDWWVAEHLHQCRWELAEDCLPLLPGIRPLEGMVLRYRETGKEILLLHGHQADFFNDRLAPLSKFLVRHVWHPMELIGVQDPFSASRNLNKKQVIDRKLSAFAKREEIAMVAGHTHRAIFPGVGETPYFNDGCCVHPRYISAIELRGSGITLVMWTVEARRDGVLYVGRQVVKGPVSLEDYFAHKE